MGHFLSAFLSGALDELGLGALPGFLSDPWGSVRDEFLEPFRDWAQDFIDNVVPSAYQDALERVRDLAESIATTGETVFNDIADAVRDALDSGEIAPQTDGGLGQVSDNFTPDGEVPINIGTLPGISTPGGGMNRDGGGGGGGYSGAPSGGSSPTTPLGETGGDTTPESSADAGPSLQDLGIDPNSGAYVEYQPTEGQVEITYPDGTTETRPWP